MIVQVVNFCVFACVKYEIVFFDHVKDGIGGRVRFRPSFGKSCRSMPYTQSRRFFCILVAGGGE